MKNRFGWLALIYTIITIECHFTHAEESEVEIITLKKKPSNASDSSTSGMNRTTPYGIIYEEDPSPPMFYDTFFPIMFEIKMPEWNSTDLRLILPQEFSNVSKFCNETSTQADLWGATVCPIMSKLNELLDEFAIELKTIESFNATTLHGNQKYSSCHEIKPHFSHHIVDDSALELYILKAIMDCPLQDIIHHRYEVTHVNQTKYTELLKEFFEIYINPRYRMGGYVKYAASTNILLSIHATELFEHLMYAQEWSSSMATCNSQRIPHLLVSQDTLKSALLEIKASAQMHGLELTIREDDLSSYYKLALADCAMTSTNTYLVRILVPLTKILANYQLVNLRSVPFISRELPDETLVCFHHTPFKSIIIQGNTRMPIAVPKCDASKLLCQVPAEGDRPLFDQCILDTLFNRTANVVVNCRRICENYDDSLLPFIQRVKSDQFAIVGKSSAEIAVMCGGDKKPLKLIEVPEHVGSLLVTVPCGCYITHRAEKYHIDGDCGFNFDVLPVKAILFDDVVAHYKEHFKTIAKLADSEDSKNLSNEFNQIGNDDEIAEEFKNAVLSSLYEAAGGVTWPMYLAFVFSLIGIICLVAACYVLRNVFIRVGQLELSIAKNNCPVTEFSNVTFNVRSAANDTAY